MAVLEFEVQIAARILMFVIELEDNLEKQIHYELLILIPRG